MVILIERNRRISELCNDLGLEELWERVRFWSSLWASVSSEFRGIIVLEIGWQL